MNLEMLHPSWGKSGEKQRLQARQRRLELMDSLGAVPPKGSKIIPLNKGKYALVDEADYDWINQWNWHLSKCGYAIRFWGKKGVFMHRLILDVPNNLFVDHINRNTLDNRRSNIRLATKSQNGANRWKPKTGIHSKYKGVIHPKGTNYYVGFGGHMGKCYYLGSFKIEEDAARAYNKWAREHFGEFALLNAV